MRLLLPITLPGLLAGQYKCLNPRVTEVAAAVSRVRMEASLRRLEAHLTRGIGAARRWLHAQFNFGPCLEVELDRHMVRQR
jgi:hypothetical protein